MSKLTPQLLGGLFKQELYAPVVIRLRNGTYTVPESDAEQAELIELVHEEIQAVNDLLKQCCDVEPNQKRLRNNQLTNLHLILDHLSDGAGEPGDNRRTRRNPSVDMMTGEVTGLTKDNTCVAVRIMIQGEEAAKAANTLGMFLRSRQTLQRRAIASTIDKFDAYIYGIDVHDCVDHG